MSERKIIPVLKIENAELLGGSFKNFKGEERKFNDAGKRNFCVVIPEDMVEQLCDDGWNIKTLEPLEEGDPVKYYTQVMINYRSSRPPMVILHTNGGGAVELNEDTIGELDDAYIVHCDVAINPHPWDTSTGSGIKGYLKSMHVTIEDMDDFADKYREE